MKLKNKILYGVLALIMVVSISSTQVIAQAPLDEGLVIDHTSVALYDQIPVEYLRLAEQIKFLIIDRSVGSNIYDGISCLASSSWASSLSSCRRDYIDSSLTAWKTYTANDTNVPNIIRFPGGNSKANISFLAFENTWEQDLASYITYYRANQSGFDVMTYGHNYLHVNTGSTIASVYFDSSYNGTNVFDVLQLEADYPQKQMVYWTTSLARTVGTAESTSFNSQMRNWTVQNNKVLFDLADIESHRPDGSLCTNAQGYPIICKEYTTEVSGGHLGSVSGGKIIIAKAIWVMLAQIAGWNPDGSSTPTPVTPTLIPTPTFTPTPEPICVWMTPEEYQAYLDWKNSLP